MGTTKKLSSVINRFSPETRFLLLVVISVNVGIFCAKLGGSYGHWDSTEQLIVGPPLTGLLCVLLLLLMRRGLGTSSLVQPIVSESSGVKQNRAHFPVSVLVVVAAEWVFAILWHSNVFISLLSLLVALVLIRFLISQRGREQTRRN